MSAKNNNIYNSIFFDKLNTDRNIDSSCLILYNPKRIQSNEILLKLHKKLYYPNSIQDTTEISYPKNLNTRSEKKHKNSKNLLIDRLDLKKYKNKPKIKSRSQIQINNNDLHIDYNNEIQSPLDVEEVRSFKQIKTKKITKTSQERKLEIQKNHVISQRNASESIQKVDSNQILFKSSVSVYELANVLSISEIEVIKYLFLKGIRVTINTILPLETAKLVAETYGFSVSISTEIHYMQDCTSVRHNTKEPIILNKRAPIVALLGHVDHGKTTLLDTICQINVSQKEQGGITQTICAYEIKINNQLGIDKLIFLDTPGHSAFSTMRAISTQVTDICILVVAADDGLQEQTLEIIKRLKSNKISYIVAINKIDKPDANISKIRQELADLEIIGQDKGGSIPVIEVSGLTHKNVDKLLNTIIDLANSKNLTATSKACALGTILDSYLNPTKGPIANLIVQDGTLQTGDLLVSGNTVSKIRAIIDNKNNQVEYTGPSSVVEILGLSNILCSGDSFYVIKNDKFIKKELYQKNKNVKHSSIYNKFTSSYFYFNSNNQSYDENNKYINLILKTETQSSIDALLKAFNDIPQKKVRLNIMSIAIGQITINDIKFASVSNSIIVSFTNCSNSLTFSTKREAEKLNIFISNFTVIYDLLEYLKNLMLDLVDIEYKEHLIGHAIVKNIFTINKGVVAGCYVISGKLKQNSYIRVIRNKNIIHNGKLSSLKRVKEEVLQVLQGYECGLLSENFHMWQKKDEIIAYELIPQTKKL
uniref:Translation initiation factor IF-2, chloroplastic n=1 Tax=Thorea hispida TaxID=202687 RepID=A0A1C9CAC4_9FLOR|nr:translation initiation factor 2 [Thorea hispida]AOM65326.1 translation initiation factor 2 [Thorea hispida]ARX95886.1 translation initiation factor 2 [Thorea hispida]UNJ79171.1 translation initiation factor 2 [Thorea hispida]